MALLGVAVPGVALGNLSLEDCLDILGTPFTYPWQGQIWLTDAVS